MRTDLSGLRQRVADLQSENTRLNEQKGTLREEISTLQHRYRRDQQAYDLLERHLIEAESEIRRLDKRDYECGFQTTYLASLYAASSCLHETADRREVLEVIRDIVVNLIGSQELAVYEMNEEGDALQLAYSNGIEAGGVDTIPVGLGLLGAVAATGEPYVAGLCDASPQLPREVLLSAGIPLKIGARVTGVIALFRLLPQKAGTFDQLDHKLFALLADQAGASLFRTALMAELDTEKYQH